MTLKPRTLVGESPLLLGGSQPATVIAESGGDDDDDDDDEGEDDEPTLMRRPVTALAISWRDFAAQMEKHPDLMAALRAAAKARAAWAERRLAGDAAGDGFDFDACLPLTESEGSTLAADDADADGGAADAPPPSGAAMGSFSGGNAAFFASNDTRDQRTPAAPPPPLGSDGRLNLIGPWSRWKDTATRTLSVAPEAIRLCDVGALRRAARRNGGLGDLAPFPTITRNRLLHGSKLPTLDKGGGGRAGSSSGGGATVSAATGGGSHGVGFIDPMRVHHAERTVRERKQRAAGGDLGHNAKLITGAMRAEIDAAIVCGCVSLAFVSPPVVGGVPPPPLAAREAGKWRQTHRPPRGGVARQNDAPTSRATVPSAQVPYDPPHAHAGARDDVRRRGGRQRWRRRRRRRRRVVATEIVDERGDHGHGQGEGRAARVPDADARAGAAAPRGGGLAAARHRRAAARVPRPRRRRGGSRRPAWRARRERRRRGVLLAQRRPPQY